jgi:transketolase
MKRLEKCITQKEFLTKAGEIDRLELIATKTRKDAIENITKTGVGHPGGSLSIVDFLTVLYFGKTYDSETGCWEGILRYDPSDPLWSNRDRVVLSKGHAAPALYATLAQAGFFCQDLLKIYRKIDSTLEGHPAMYRVIKENDAEFEYGTKGVDFSTGSLGHGLSIGAGMALHAKVYGYEYNVYVVLSDGELQEGMVWEACLTIPNKKLNNVFGFIDYNRLQVDGSVDEINQLEPLEDKLRAFNWDVHIINGHDFYAMIDTLEFFKKTRGESQKPLMVIANTIKGKGIPEIENVCKYHALPLTMREFERVEKDFLSKIETLEKKISARKPELVGMKPLIKYEPKEEEQDFSEIIRRNPPKSYSQPTATRIGYGNSLARLGEYKKIFVANADLAGACGVTKFVERYPEDAGSPIERRSINVGVQEANMMAMAAGIASCGKIPVVNSFGIFSTGRAWEMVRQDISYPKQNVKIIGSHTGIALGEYGVSHQATEDVGAMRILPNIAVIEPSDAIQADCLFQKAIQYEGPVYFRVGRNATPLIYSESNLYGITPIKDFEIGKGYKIREGKDIAFICSGPILVQALLVAQMVKESVCVVDMPTIRPIDGDMVEEAAIQARRICTVQDHFKNGGLKDEVLDIISSRRLSVVFDFVALSGFAKSGSPADLYEKYGLSARGIIKKLGLTVR